MILKLAKCLALCTALTLVMCSCGTINSVPDPDILQSKMASVNTTEAVTAAAETVSETVTETIAEPITEQFTVDINRHEFETCPDNFEIGGVEAVLQEPELPTGCEVTALTTLLNYLGFDVDKETLADDFMPITLIGEVVMDEAYVGNPHIDGFGCNANVIVQTADRYFASLDSPCYGVDLTGTEFDDLLYQVTDGRPVLTWTTINLTWSRDEYMWTAGNGSDFYFNPFQHCVVLYGYDKNAKTVKVADPLKGNVEYDIDRFRTMYDIMGKQAVVICGDSETGGHHVTSDAERAVTMKTYNELTSENEEPVPETVEIEENEPSEKESSPLTEPSARVGR